MIGSIVAGFAATLIEHALFRGLFIPPSEIQLGLRNRRSAEKVLAILSAQFEYKPLPEAIRTELLLGVNNSGSIGEKAEGIFFVSHAKAMSLDVSQKRLGSFQNQYGLYRNLALTFILIFVMSLFSNETQYRTLFIWGSLTVAILMFLRFVKYYAAFSKEVFRAGR